MNKLMVVLVSGLMLTSSVEVSARNRYGSDCPSCKSCNRGSCGTRDCGVKCGASCSEGGCSTGECPVVAGAPRRSSDGFTVSEQELVSEGSRAPRGRRAAAVVVAEETDVVEEAAPRRSMKKQTQKVEKTVNSKTSRRVSTY